MALSSGSRVFDGVLGFLGLVAFTFLFTFSYTTVQFALGMRRSRSRNVGREPIGLPYFIPFVGNTFQMANLHRLYEDAASKSFDNRPFSLKLGSMKMYLIFGSSNVQYLFQNFKNLAKDGLTRQSFQNTASGAGKDGAIRNIIDDTMAEKIGKKLHDLQFLMLSPGPSSDFLASKFVSAFSSLLNEEQTGLSTKVPIFNFLQNVMFKASTTALMGTQILSLSPNLVKVYWEYDEAFLLGLPELLYPQGEAARDRLLSAVKKYIVTGHKRYDVTAPDDKDWEENFGSRLFRSCIKELTERGISHEDQAATILSLVWATSSNSVPASAWMIIEATKQAEMVNRIRDEVKTAVLPTDQNGDMGLDLDRLAKLPLLNSLYLEVLRLRTSVTVSRKLVADMQIDGYRLRRGGYVMTPSWLPHTSPEIWSFTDHDPAEFWPERFLPSDHVGSRELSTDARQKASCRLEKALRPENFFPYGGGGAICPGRHFSKLEILSSVALILLKFDLRAGGYLDSDGHQSDQPLLAKENYAGGGVMPPDGDLLLRMTRNT